jgi:long-chain acyl-CoA synthetase
MGGEIKWMLSGSAAAPVWLLEFFHSIGLLVLEAYGITENPVPIAVNRPDAFRFGSVGRPFAMNQLRFDEHNEVLVKGPALFGGYLGEGPPKDRYTSDGYYRTGDYGRLDEDGFLFLTGRVAEIIKTSTGRRISPAAIEGVYRQSRYIDQIMVVGNNRPHLVALIVLNAVATPAGQVPANTQTLPGADGATSRDRVELIEKELNSLGQRVARHERIHAFTVLSAPFSVENGELTPTLKFRRDRIEARYADAIDNMYRDGSVAPMPVGFSHRQSATEQGAT